MPHMEVFYMLSFSITRFVNVRMKFGTVASWALIAARCSLWHVSVPLAVFINFLNAFSFFPSLVYIEKNCFGKT